MLAGEPGEMMSGLKVVTLFSVLLLATNLLAEIPASASLAGHARDGAGNAVGGVRITLTSISNPKSSYQITSDSAGGYRFAGLATGEYRLTAEVAGYDSFGPIRVQVKSPSIQETMDFTLVRTEAELASSEPKRSSSPPKFQTSGIRGVIDPGGYSASTNGAPSDLLRGMAGLKRDESGTDTQDAKDQPCGHEAELRAAVAEHPDIEKPNLELGQFYVAHGEPKRAISLFKRALEIDQSDATASLDLANALILGGDFEAARRVLLRQADPREGPKVHQLLARVDEGAGEFLEAAAEYRRAESEESSKESIFGEGFELILAGSVADAAKVFEAGVRTYPQSISIRLGLGITQCLQGETSSGLLSFLDATDINPDDSRSYAFVASASSNSQVERDRVLNSLKKYFDRRPDSAAANYYYAIALWRRNPSLNTSRIEALLKRAIALNPDFAKAHLALANVYFRNGNYQDAIPELQETLRLDPAMNEAHYRLAMAYRNLGRKEKEEREMSVFLQSKKDAASKSDGDAINIAQFISVMGHPGESPHRESRCPGSYDAK